MPRAQPNTPASVRPARHGDTPIGRSLTRISYAKEALDDLWRELKAPLHSAAEIHMDDVGEHIAMIRFRLRAAYLALESVATEAHPNPVPVAAE